MRSIFAALFLAVLSAVALANGDAERPNPNTPVKSGYEVEGCTFYELKDGKVVEVCNPRDAKRVFDPRFRDSGPDSQ